MCLNIRLDRIKLADKMNKPLDGLIEGLESGKNQGSLSDFELLPPVFLSWLSQPSLLRLAIGEFVCRIGSLESSIPAPSISMRKRALDTAFAGQSVKPAAPAAIQLGVILPALVSWRSPTVEAGTSCSDCSSFETPITAFDSHSAT